MARVLDWVPEAVKQYIKLLLARRRYPGCTIASYLIAPGAELGRDCTIGRDVELGPRVSIGDYSYVNTGSVVASGRIGKFCSIGYFCQVGMPEHPVNYLSTSPRIYGSKNVFGIPAYWNDYPSSPLIDNDVWIGSQALILQGVRIGNGAVVAGGSVVTKDVAPYSIVAGVPAKETRRRFEDPVIEVLLKMEWWNMSVAELMRLRELFELGEQAIDALPGYMA